LAGVRVKQKNLVYVIGICPTTKDESQILQTLRGEQHFGQYGEIDKIVVSKAKIGSPQSQGIGVYVTYATKEAAALCIAQVDGSSNGDKVLRYDCVCYRLTLQPANDPKEPSMVPPSIVQPSYVMRHATTKIARSSTRPERRTMILLAKTQRPHLLTFLADLI